MFRGGITLSIALLCAFGASDLHAEGGAILGGVAANVAAGASIGAAAAAAGSDVAISALSADVAMYQTDRFSRVSEFQAKLQQQTALAMAGMQYAINGYNQMQTTTRLQMQLDAIARSSALTQKMSSDSLKREYSLLNRQLDLQEKTIDQQTRLSMMQPGSYSLFASQNSGDLLSTRSYNLTRPKSTEAASNRLLSSLGNNPNTPTATSPVSSSSLLSRIGSQASRTRVTSTASSVAGGSTRGRVGTLPSTALRRAFVGSDWPRHSAREANAGMPRAIGAGHSEAGHSHHGHSAGIDSGTVVRLGR